MSLLSLPRIPDPEVQLAAYWVRAKAELNRPREHPPVSRRQLTEQQENVLGFIAYEREYLPDPDEEYANPFL